jgi:hypothetical protein
LRLHFTAAQKSCVATLFLVFCLIIPSAFATPAVFAATSVKVVGSFNVPSDCCSNYVSANGNVFGIGSSEVYVFSGTSNAVISIIPMSGPYYLMYDSVDKTVLVLGNAHTSCTSACSSFVSIGTTTYNVITNTTVPFSFNFYPYENAPKTPPITYDSHNDEIYTGSTSFCPDLLNGTMVCQVYVLSAKSLSIVKTISFAAAGYASQVWSVVYDSKNNEIFASASDGPQDLALVTVRW